MDFFRRWIIIDFPHRFLDNEDIDELSEEDKSSAKQKDPEVISKLIDAPELSGLLNWCLDGYDRLKANKKFSNCQTIQKIKQAWLRKSSSISAFCSDCVVEDYDGVISKQEFKQKYVDYCRRHKLRVFGDKFINNVLTKEFAVVEFRPFNNGEDRDRCWKGISFKNVFGVED